MSFTPACNKHDICWGVCGSSKKKCDKEFRDDLFELCDDRYGKWNFVALALCRSQAHFYYIAVVEGGEGAFESAQNEHCVWEECCEID